MSLSEKLSGLSKNLIEAKKQEEKINEDRELEPIRNKIKDLKSEVSQLELIKNSLELKSDKSNGIGKGMKDYSVEVGKNALDKSAKLDVLIEENKEALKTLGIEDKDKLVENEEFAEDEEAVEYKKSKKEEKGLKMSDSALQKKLKSFGLDGKDENFSYDTAEKLINEKLQSVEAELTQEKLKTPEGKEEAMESIIEKIEGDIPKTSFSQDEKTKEYKFAFGDSNYNGRGVNISGDKVNFKRYFDPELLPRGVEVIKLKYGNELTKEAICNYYKQEIEKSFIKYDHLNGGLLELEKELESASPKEGIKTREELESFFTLQQEFRKVIQKKSDELKSKGIDFGTEYPPTYGGSYEDMIKLAGDKVVNTIKREMENVGVFPPKFDYKKLQISILEKKTQLQGFIDAVKNINTEEDIEIFDSGSGYRGGDSLISKWRLDLHTERIELYNLKSVFDTDDSPQYNKPGARDIFIKELRSKSTSYEQAKEYLNTKLVNLEELKDKVSSMTNLAVEAQFKRMELSSEMVKQSFGKDVGMLRHEIAEIEKQKKDADDLTIEIASLEARLPNEEVVLKGKEIKIISVEKEVEEKKKDIDNKKVELKTLEKDILNKEGKEPWFGKDKWKNELSLLKEKKEVLIEEVSTLNKEYSELLDKKYLYIKTNRFSETEKIVEKQSEIQGLPNQIFENIKKELSKMLDQKVPESVLNLYNEYTKLEEQLG